MNQKEHVPKSNLAFGIWKSRNLDGIAYQKKLRAEWDSHFLAQKMALKEDK